MNKILRAAALLAVLATTSMVWPGSLLAVQDGAAVARPVLTPEQMEAFLLKARVVRTKGVDKGVTNTRRATLSDGQITHDAQIQTVDISKALFQPDRGVGEVNFKDSYRYNIAAYRLSRLVGLDSVPMSVERNVDGKASAVTWWIDDVLMDEGQRLKKQTTPLSSRVAAQVHIMRVFDALIANSDRNLGNLLWTAGETMWLIDHTRAFRLDKQLKAPGILQRCERGLFEKMHQLTAEGLAREMGNSMNKAEISALLARRDAIVTLFDGLIARRGEGAILYTLPPPS
jgi:hypothetical protein